jgi:hypothetical protein
MEHLRGVHEEAESNIMAYMQRRETLQHSTSLTGYRYIDSGFDTLHKNFTESSFGSSQQTDVTLADIYHALDPLKSSVLPAIMPSWAVTAQDEYLAKGKLLIENDVQNCLLGCTAV